MSRNTDRTIARLCMGAALVWALALPLAAYGASRQPGASPLALAPHVVYAVGAIVCHQQPERSFASWGTSWPVCARCTGIYMGAAAAALVGLVRRRRPTLLQTPTRARLVVAVGILPSILTLVYEWTTGQAPGNVTRLLAGLPIGLTVIAVIASASGAEGSTAARP